MNHSRRTYRQSMQPPGFVGFTAKYKETDLYVAVGEAGFTEKLPGFTENRILFYRTQLENYLAQDPVFRTTLEPHLLPLNAPPMALAMTKAANMAGWGPWRRWQALCPIYRPGSFSHHS